jgi:hypothetical protein
VLVAGADWRWRASSIAEEMLPVCASASRKRLQLQQLVLAVVAGRAAGCG